jgi:hypothetical protein
VKAVALVRNGTITAITQAEILRQLDEMHAMHDVGSRHYDRYSYLREKRAAMARWSAWLDRLLGQPDPQVLPFVGSPPRNIAQ